MNGSCTFNRRVAICTNKYEKMQKRLAIGCWPNALVVAAHTNRVTPGIATSEAGGADSNV